MAAPERVIYVYENWSSDTPVLLGRLFADYGRKEETVAFAYDAAWLRNGGAKFALDPNLALYGGGRYVPLTKAQFGLFTDSCPDRWGRLLMNRKELIQARKEGRKPRKLTETDCLLGVWDTPRMGALRFSLEENGPFLSRGQTTAAPPWSALHSLEAASFSFERAEDGLGETWLNQLLGPGACLGGARPKATVRSPDGTLWIAKFPSINDEYNSGAREKTVHDLARMCGLDVPESKLETCSKRGGTFLVKRFDRDGTRRIHFASAKTLLGKTDKASWEDGSSYLELMSFLRANGAIPQKDLPELWKRIVFNMAVSNTDDHLRNHGFLLTEEGWRLSPMYDVNPDPYGEQLSLNVSEYDASISMELALEVAEFFDVDEKNACRIAEDVCRTVRDNLLRLARLYGLKQDEIDLMRPAFSACD